MDSSLGDAVREEAVELRGGGGRVRGGPLVVVTCPTAMESLDTTSWTRPPGWPWPTATSLMWTGQA